MVIDVLGFRIRNFSFRWGCIAPESLCAQLGVFLDSQLLLKEQVAVMIRKYLQKFVLRVSCTLSLNVSPVLCHSCPSHLEFELLHCALHGTILEEYLKATAGTEGSCTDCSRAS